MLEKRGYERFSLNGRVAIKSEDPNCNVSSAPLNNFSFSGISVLSDNKIAVDKVVHLELTTEFSLQPLACKGKIRHIREMKSPGAPVFVMGIQFIDINQNLVTYIIKRISSRISEKLRAQNKVWPIDFMPY